MKIIHITGPESTGKSTLSEYLVHSLPHAILVKEYARFWLESRKQESYTEQEVLEMFHGQCAWWRNAKSVDSSYLICDTDTLVYAVWMSFVYHHVHPEVVLGHHEFEPDISVLCAPDIPWEFDPLRSNPEDRQALFLLYQKELEKLSRPYFICKGEGEDRMSKVLSDILTYFSIDHSKEKNTY